MNNKKYKRFRQASISEIIILILIVPAILFPLNFFLPAEDNKSLYSIISLLSIPFVIKISNRNKRKKYDERQVSINGVIYEHVLFILIGLLLLNSFLIKNNIIWADNLNSTFIMIMISATTGVLEAIIRDSFFASNENFKDKLKSILIISISSSLLLIFTIFLIIRGEKMVSDSSLSDNGVILIWSLLSFTIGLCLIIKLLFDKSTKNEEEEL